MVRDEALQPTKRQFMKTDESSETIVSPADAEDSALKEFELHTCGWTTKDTPPPYTWGAAVSCDMCCTMQRHALTNAPRESPINHINKIQKRIHGTIRGSMRASTQEASHNGAATLPDVLDNARLFSIDVFSTRRPHLLQMTASHNTEESP